MLKFLCFAMMFSLTLGAQNTTGPSGAHTAAPPQASPGPPPSDDLDRMRLDLDHMDGLLNNMSSEIEFLHDQNLQILLRTNAQMWTLLLRDMRMQLAREQQRHAAPEPEPPKSPAPKAH